MGWYGTPGATKEDIVAEIQSDFQDGAILDQAVTTEHGTTCLWIATKSRQDGRTGVVLYAISKSGDCWGYKPMSEDMGPYYHSCPLRLLNKTEGWGGYGADWRARVRMRISKDRP